MKIKKKIIFLIIFALCVVLIGFIIRELILRPYKSALPEIPDQKALTIPLQEQISDSHQNAYKHPSAENLGNLGMVYHSSGFYEKAVVCYQLAIKRDPDSWIWDYYLGCLKEEMGDSKEAIRIFSQLLVKNPKAFHAWYYIGEGYQKMGMDDKAQEAYHKISDIQDNSHQAKTLRVNYFPLSVNARFQLARIYVNQKQLSEAEKILKEIITNTHTYSPVYRLLGNIYATQGDSIRSKKNIIRAKDLADYTPMLDTLLDKLALISRSELYLPKQIDDAIKSANPEWATLLQDHALTYFPDNKHQISKSIKFYLRMDIGKNALPYLDKHMKLFSDNFKELKELGDLLFKKNFYQQAFDYYNKCTVLKPDEPEINSSIALCTWKLGKPEKASALMIDLVEKNLKFEKLVSNGADFMLMIDKKDQAREWITKLPQSGDKSSGFFKLSGKLAEKEGDTTKAISYYELAFRKDPEDITIVQALGTLLLEKKQWGKAINLFKSSLQRHPNEPFLLERLGALLISCPDAKFRQMDEGKELSERAFYNIASPSPNILSAGRNLVQAFAVEGDFSTAKFYMNIVLSMARDEKVPQEYYEGLLNLARKLERFKSKAGIN